MKKIAIYGSGGSIGRQALEFIDANKEEFCAYSIVTYSNYELLLRQAEKFKPKYIGLINTDCYSANEFDSKRPVVGGEAANACLDCDVILFCVVGIDALPALMSFVKNGKRIALANKECLVSAGEIIMREAKKYGAEIIPVDSEHSAIWQCLRAGEKKDVNQIILTASGGRYYSCSVSELKKITPEQAIKHPNWKMGKKISVDSATMINKALELIEARWLFDSENIGYIIHPDSIIHSMVQFKDGAIIAQLSEPDMKLPISVALSYPERKNSGIKNFTFDRPLTFLPKREDVFFAPTLASYCIKVGGTSGAILDAADEGAVKLFLDGKILFTDIADIVKEELFSAEIEPITNIERIIKIHNEVKQNVINKYITRSRN